MAEDLGNLTYQLQVTTSGQRGRPFTVAMPEIDRFWSKVQLSREGCWLWLGAPNRDGYGTFRRTLRPGVYRMVRAHRFAYELLIGPIPEGLTLDHLCLTPACVRPSHLEPVPNSENLKRRHARSRATGHATGNATTPEVPA